MTLMGLTDFNLPRNCATSVLRELERGALPGHYLRCLRSSLKMTPSWFGDRLGLTGQAVASLEHTVVVPDEFYPVISALCREVLDA